MTTHKKNGHTKSDGNHVKAKEEAKEYNYEAKVEGLTVYLQPSLDWMATLIPRWLAPNVITLGGGLLILLATFIVIWNLPAFYGPVPVWVCLVAIIGTAGFVILDNLDGRHAKAINNCSKLGDFLDHGVDSIADPLSVLMMAAITQGGYSMPLWLFLIGMGLVCLTNIIYLWADRHTHIAVVSDFQLEAYSFIIGTFVLTAIFGEELWTFDLKTVLPISFLPFELGSKLPGELPLNIVLNTLALILPLTEYYDALARVLHTTGSYKPFADLLSPILLSCGLFIWDIFSTSNIFETQKMLTAFMVVMSYSFVTGRFNLCRLNGTPMTVTWEVYLLLAIGILVSVFKVDDSLILPAFFTVITLGTIHFYWISVMTIAAQLKIPILTVKKTK